MPIQALPGIAPEEVDGKLLSGLPDTPQFGTAEMQERFDAQPNLIREKLNAVVEAQNANNALVLAKDNTEPFTPVGDYNPATKKYVEDMVNEGGNVTPDQVERWDRKDDKVLPADCGYDPPAFTLTGLPETLPEIFTVRFKAPADFNEGETFFIGSAQYDALLSSMEAAPDRMFREGAVVTANVDTTSQKIYLSSGGGMGGVTFNQFIMPKSFAVNKSTWDDFPLPEEGWRYQMMYAWDEGDYIYFWGGNKYEVGFVYNAPTLDAGSNPRGMYYPQKETITRYKISTGTWEEKSLWPGTYDITLQGGCGFYYDGKLYSFGGVAICSTLISMTNGATRGSTVTWNKLFVLDLSEERPQWREDTVFTTIPTNQGFANCQTIKISNDEYLIAFGFTGLTGSGAAPYNSYLNNPGNNLHTYPADTPKNTIFRINFATKTFALETTFTGHTLLLSTGGGNNTWSGCSNTLVRAANHGGATVPRCASALVYDIDTNLLYMYIPKAATTSVNQAKLFFIYTYNLNTKEWAVAFDSADTPWNFTDATCASQQHAAFDLSIPVLMLLPWSTGKKLFLTGGHVTQERAYLWEVEEDGALTYYTPETPEAQFPALPPVSCADTLTVDNQLYVFGGQGPTSVAMNNAVAAAYSFKFGKVFSLSEDGAPIDNGLIVGKIRKNQWFHSNKPFTLYRHNPEYDAETNPDAPEVLPLEVTREPQKATEDIYIKTGEYLNLSKDLYLYVDQRN